MEQKYTYHKDEKIINTLDGIIDFILTNPYSNRITMDMQSVKNVLEMKSNTDPNQNYIIFSESLWGKEGKWIVRKCDENSTVKKFLMSIIEDRFNIITTKIGGEGYVFYDIITFPGNTEHAEDYNVQLSTSPLLSEAYKNIRQSKECIEKFKM